MLRFPGLNRLFFGSLFIFSVGCASGTQDIADSVVPISGGVEIFDQTELNGMAGDQQVEMMSEQEIETAFLSAAESD